MTEYGLPVMGMSAAVVIVSAACGGILIIAAIMKCRNWRPFRDVVAFLLGSDGNRVTDVAAVLFVTGEFLLGILLVLGVKLTASLVAFVIFVACTTWVLAVLARRRYAGSCGCFGESSGRRAIGWLPFVRNALLVVVATACLVAVGSGSADAIPPRTWSTAYVYWGLAATLLLVVGLAYQLIEAACQMYAGRATVRRSSEMVVQRERYPS